MKPEEKFNYCDSFSTIITDDNYSIDYLTGLCFNITPKWVNPLVKLRAILVKPFGLTTEMPKDTGKIDRDIKYDIGKKALFFTVFDRNDNEIVASENDKHLYFRTSALKTKVDDNKIEVHLTTIVKYHNIGGRINFFFVKPFHRLIVKSMLKTFIKRVGKNEN